MTREEEIRRGNEARMVLGHALFQEAWDQAAKSLENQRRKAPVKDTELHTKLILTEQLLYILKGFFEQTIQTGKMAEIQVEEEKRRKSLFKFGT